MLLPIDASASFQPALFRVAAFDNELVRTVVFCSGLVAQRRFAPRGNRPRTSDRALALTTTVRMVAGVHDRAAYSRPPAHVAAAARFTVVDVLRIDIADLADRRDADFGEIGRAHV